SVQDPLVHHRCHFGQTVHSFCSIQTLLTNSIMSMAEDVDMDSLSAIEQKELEVFCELMKMVPGLEAHLMASSEDEVIDTADLIQRGVNGSRTDDTKGMKSAIIDWIMPKGQSLNLYIPWNAKTSRGFNHEHTGALLCPAGLDWKNSEMQSKLMNGQIQVAGDQWPVFLYANYMYDPEDPWNRLLQSGLLVSAYKHIFTSPSSVEQEPKATCSGNAWLHRMQVITKASIAYVATQACFGLTSTQVFSCTDLITDLEHFYTSILELLGDPEEKEEVDQHLGWWNRQIFPLYADLEHVPLQNSALMWIRQKHQEQRASSATMGASD
ncbi:hypothetical protein SCLCIDRAFT_111676, partial [Scleroderma citrinum Foug A]